MSDTNEPLTRGLHVLPYEETRAALAHAIERPRGHQAWLTRNHARVHWRGEWVSIGYDPVHTRVILTIELPYCPADSSWAESGEWIVTTGHGGEYDRPNPWQAAFDEALSALLDTLALHLTEAKRGDEAQRLLNALGFD